MASIEGGLRLGNHAQVASGAQVAPKPVNKTAVKAGETFEISGQQYKIDRRCSDNSYFATDLTTRKTVSIRLQDDAEEEYAAFLQAPKLAHLAKYLGVGKLGDAPCLISECIPDTKIVDYRTLARMKISFTYVEPFTAIVSGDTRAQVLAWWKAINLDEKLMIERIDGEETQAQLTVKNPSKHGRIDQILGDEGLKFSNPKDVVVNYKNHILSHLENTYQIQGRTYQIVRLIDDSGSYGDVFLAKDVKTGEQVTIKILRVDVDGEQGAMYKIHELGGHPNIVRYIGHGQILRKNCIVMEFLDGETYAAYTQHHQLTKELEAQLKSANTFLDRHWIKYDNENFRYNVMIITNDPDGKPLEQPLLKRFDFGTLVE